MVIKRIIAEILAFVCAFLITVFPAGILAGTTANVFWPVFIIIGGISYIFIRPWMYDVLEAKPVPIHRKSTKRK